MDSCERVSGLMLIKNTIGSFSLDCLEDVMSSGGWGIGFGGRRRSGGVMVGIAVGSGS